MYRAVKYGAGWGVFCTLTRCNIVLFTNEKEAKKEAKKLNYLLNLKTNYNDFKIDTTQNGL